MTDEEPAGGPERPAAATEPATGPGDGEAAGTAQDGPSREAANWRRKLRAAEAERDGLRARMEVRDRRDVERIAAESMAAPGDLWHVVADLNGLRDEAGDLDPEAVEAAVGDVLADRPHWRKPPGRQRDPDQGKGNGAGPGASGSWAAMFRPGG